jgi:hypothetical protein
MDDHDDTVPQRVALFNRRSLARAGLEVLSIVLGVLAALAVSEWQENRQNMQRTDAALRNVNSELANNLEILEIVHANNVALIKHLTDDAAMTGQDSQFLPALQVSDSAWQTLNTTGLTGFVDLNLMLTLSQTYSLIEIYRRSGYSLIDANMWVLATATATERDMKRIDDANLFATNFISQFQLIVDIESALIDAHRGALTALGPDQVR